MNERGTQVINGALSYRLDASIRRLLIIEGSCSHEDPDMGSNWNFSTFFAYSSASQQQAGENLSLVQNTLTLQDPCENRGSVPLSSFITIITGKSGIRETGQLFISALSNAF